MSACTRCSTLKAAVSNARGDLGHTKGQLVRTQRDRPERVDHCLAEVNDRKASLAEAEAALDVHLDECTHEPPPTPRPARRLTAEQVTEIQSRARAGETQQTLADAYGVSRTTISATVNRDHTVIAGFLREEQPWADDGLCNQTDPEAFFPDKGGSTREAKAICNGNPTNGTPACPAREQCLTYAIDHDERFGIWGGLSERERRRLKATRAQEHDQAQQEVAS